MKTLFVGMVGGTASPQPLAPTPGVMDVEKAYAPLELPEITVSACPGEPVMCNAAATHPPRSLRPFPPSFAFLLRALL